MHRHQLHVKVQLGRFRDYYDVITNMNETLESKGMTPVQIWAPTAGAEMNTVILVTDHASLVEWDREMKQFMTDPEVMKLWRESAEYVEGHPREELWETAYQIA